MKTLIRVIRQLQSLLGLEPKTSDRYRVGIQHEYNKNAAIYYTNLINAIVLFALTKKELEQLASRIFDPLFELETELDYAFTPLLFETIFRNNLIDHALKPELLTFKQATDNIPDDIWDWDFLDTEQTWIDTRRKAETLLVKLGIKNKIYSNNYSVIDKHGNILNSHYEKINR